MPDQNAERDHPATSPCDDCGVEVYLSHNCERVQADLRSIKLLRPGQLITQAVRDA